MTRTLILRTCAILLALASLCATASAQTTTEPIVFKLATVAPDGTPWAKALKIYKREVEKLSGGRIKVKLFIGGAMGDENESVIACKRGRVQSAAVSVGAIATLVPELNVFELPYLFKTSAEADKVLDNPRLLEMVQKLLADRGFKLLFWSENGFRSFGTKTSAIKSPADLKGKKMRTQESPAHIAMYRAFGGSPVPIPVTEVLTSLQTGVVEGFDNTPIYSFAASWQTAVKFYSVTEHIYQPALIVVKSEWFNALPADLQKVFLDARGDIPLKLRGTLRAMNPILLTNFEKAGISVYRLSAAEKAAFYPMADKARADFIAGATPSTKALYEVILAGLKGR